MQLLTWWGGGAWFAECFHPAVFIAALSQQSESGYTELPSGLHKTKVEAVIDQTSVSN